ncbi:hypothetical protein IAU60_002425 [Kwoniella sp. DSM 27419]
MLRAYAMPTRLGGPSGRTLHAMSPLARRTPSPLLRPRLVLASRPNSTSTATTASDSPPMPQATRSEPAAPRLTASFYISNVLPLKLAYWDLRPSWAVLREESLLERINDIAQGVTKHDFRVESLEVSRKDGGVFLHFSYLPPSASELETATEGGKEEKDRVASTTMVLPDSPGKLFVAALEDSAKQRGGWPSWLGDWWAARKLSLGTGVPGHALYSTQPAKGEDGEIGQDTQGGVLRKGDEGEKKGLQAMVGDGRIWVVKGRQWTEDMNRFPSPRLRVEFDGPDVSQEMLYTLFRPYGRVADIQPPTPVPAGSLRFATVSFSRVSPAATAINCLHGFSTPTNTADFTLKSSGEASSSTIPKSRLRLYYERPLKAHAIRDWISGHPRLALPVIAFLIGTLSYTFFDPIRAFFVRSKLEGVWDIEQYSFIKTLRQKFVLPTSFGFLSGSGGSGSSEEAIGKDAWKDRIEAEKDVERWLSEYPGTFITITGPPGSGKVSLVSRVLKQQQK